MSLHFSSINFLAGRITGRLLSITVNGPYEMVMRNFLEKLYSTSCWIGATCIALICLLVVCQVLLNLLDRLSTLITGSAIGLTIPSYSDFTGFLLVGASFLALAHTFREGAHIRVVLLLGRLPDKIRKILEVWCVGFGLLLTLYFSWFTAKLTWESYSYNDLSPGMIAIPIWIPQAAMLFGLVILTITLIDELVRVCSGRVPRYEEKAERLLEDAVLAKDQKQPTGNRER